MSKTLITFYRYVLIFNVIKPRQNLSMAHDLVLKGSFITSLVPVFLTFAQNLIHTFFHTLGYQEYDAGTNTTVYL